MSARKKVAPRKRAPKKLVAAIESAEKRATQPADEKPPITVEDVLVQLRSVTAHNERLSEAFTQLAKENAILQQVKLSGKASPHDFHMEGNDRKPGLAREVEPERSWGLLHRHPKPASLTGTVATVDRGILITGKDSAKSTASTIMDAMAIDLKDAMDRVYGLRRRIEDLADAQFGTLEGDGGAEFPEADGKVGRVLGLVQRLHATITGLERQVERLEVL